MPKRQAPNSDRQPLASGTRANSTAERYTADKQRQLHLQARRGRGPDRRGRKRRGRNSWVGQGSGKKRAKPGTDEDGTAGEGAGGGTTEHLGTFVQDALTHLATKVQELEDLPGTLAAVTDRLDSLGLGSAHPQYADPEAVRLRAELVQGHACLLELAEAADEAHRTLQLAKAKAAEAEQLEAQQAGGRQAQPQTTASPAAEPEGASTARGIAEGQGQSVLDAGQGQRAIEAGPQAVAADLGVREAVENAVRAERERLAAKRWQMDLEWEELNEHKARLAAKEVALNEWVAAKEVALNEWAAAMLLAQAQLDELRQSLLTWASQLAERQHELDRLQAELKQQKRSQPRGPRGAYHKFTENCPRQQKDIMIEVQRLLELKTKDDVQAFFVSYFSHDDHVEQFVGLVLALKHLLLDALDAQLRDRIMSGGERVPVHVAIALRLVLLLSDARYELLTHLAPGWLPPLSELRREEEKCLPPMVEVVDRESGQPVGWQVEDATKLLREAVKAHLEAGGKGCTVVVKIGTDNFSVGSKKLGTLTRYQQVAAVPIFTTPAPGSRQQRDAAVASQPPQQVPGAGSSQQQQQPPEPRQECPPLDLPVPGAAAFTATAAQQEGWEPDDLSQLGVPVGYSCDLADFLSSLQDWTPIGAEPLAPSEPDLTATEVALDEELAAMQAEWLDDIGKTLTVPYNSPLHAMPIAFCKGGEHSSLLKPIYERLNRTLLATTEMEIKGERFTFEYHNCGDFHAMCHVYGLLGQNSVFNCLWCLLRYGEHGENTVEHLHCVRTLADMVSQGTRAEQAAQALAFQQRTGMPVPGAERLSGRDTQGMKHAPLTSLGPDCCELEDLHCRINLVSTHLEHTAKLARQVGVELQAVVDRVLGFKRPTLGYEAHQSWLVLKRRAEWLQPLRSHPQFHAIRQRWDLITALTTLTHTPHLSSKQIEHFRVLGEALGKLLNEHWGKGAGEFFYPFHFYDHGVICHAYDQLLRLQRIGGSLFMFSSWYLEHMNKWWKRFLTLHSSHEGGVTKEAADTRLQCLRKFLLLTHPHMRGEVANVLKRRRGVYHCSGCGKEKYRGHTRTCRWARKLKLLNKERKLAGLCPLSKLPREFCYPNDPGVL